MISIKTTQKWLKKFKNGKRSIDNRSWFGHPDNFDKSLVGTEPYLKVNEINYFY